MEKYAYEEDCYIERDLESHPGQAVLMTCDGDILLSVPQEWTDHQIIVALRFANKAYDCGHAAGQNKKVEGFKRLFEIR